MKQSNKLDDIEYFKLLSEKYPTMQSVCREIINLNAILNLPKGTEHFMSDLHGEYEAFYHIMNNCAGVIREKVNRIFGKELETTEQQEICTLIYYPSEKLTLLKSKDELTEDWYRQNLSYLIEIARLLSSKYTRSKVRKALPEEFSYIIDELLHVQDDEDNNQISYHNKIIDTIIGIDNADEFIIALSNLIKRLAVDHLHIVGDIFDRGDRADKILDLLMNHHSMDIVWGNHDILWMGAACKSEACIATVIYNCIKYNNIRMLENGYGISLLALTLFAQKTYPELEAMSAAKKAISVILFKLEGQVIDRHPEYKMEQRKLLHTIDLENQTVISDGTVYPINDTYFPTLDLAHPYELTDGERAVMDELVYAFANSNRLAKHIRFLYAKGSMYLCYNKNLLFHGCVPLDEHGNFSSIELNGNRYQGKAYLDYADQVARNAYFDGTLDDLDFMWYLWCGKDSPLSGREIKTFERLYLDDKSSWEEQKNYYYEFYKEKSTCDMILAEFGLYSNISHIINGHTPVQVRAGEEPVKAGGKLIIIDGGFCRAYHKTTGIAGYTLIYNSHVMRLKAHQPFESIAKALSENKDIESTSAVFETEKQRLLVQDTDIGVQLQKEIDALKQLLYYYRQGIIKEVKK